MMLAVVLHDHRDHLLRRDGLHDVVAFGDALQSRDCLRADGHDGAASAVTDRVVRVVHLVGKSFQPGVERRVRPFATRSTGAERSAWSHRAGATGAEGSAGSRPGLTETTHRRLANTVRAGLAESARTFAERVIRVNRLLVLAPAAVERRGAFLVGTARWLRERHRSRGEPDD
jgi:hypothetical protein